MMSRERGWWRHALATGLVCAAIVLAQAGTAVAQSYPTREIQVIIPFDAGGSVDRMIRALAPYWEKELGVPLVLQNYSGAQGQVGFERFYRTRPDGYTIMVGTEPYLSASILRGASYDLDDFDILNVQQFDPVAITVPANSPYRTLADLLEAIRANPGKLAWGVEPGGWDYVVGHLIFDALGLEVIEVFYDGGGPLRVALMGGQIDFSLGSAAGDMAMGDRARVLAVSGTRPFPGWPEAEVLNEALKPYGVSVPNLGSVRFVAVHSSLKEQYPDRYQTLLRTYEAAISNPQFIERSRESGVELVTQFVGPEASNAQVREANAVVNEFRELFLGQ